eukprot:scaffold79247_cov30-Tisochrysis_lutea.AAC.1
MVTDLVADVGGAGVALELSASPKHWLPRSAAKRPPGFVTNDFGPAVLATRVQLFALRAAR